MTIWNKPDQFGAQNSVYGFVPLGKYYILEPVMALQSLVSHKPGHLRSKVVILDVKLYNHHQVNNLVVTRLPFHIGPVKAFGLFIVKNTRQVQYRQKNKKKDVGDQGLFENDDVFNEKGPCEDLIYSFDLVFRPPGSVPVVVGSIGYY